MLRKGSVLGVGVAMLAAGLFAVLALPRAGAATASDLPVPATAPQAAVSTGFVPHAVSSSLASSRTLASVTPGFHWVDGVMNNNAWFLNFPNYNTWGWDSAYVGYYPWTDSGGLPTGDFPQVGDVYYMHVVVGVSGNVGVGYDLPAIEAQLPQNTQLAISAANPMYCWLFNPITNQSWNESSQSSCVAGNGTYYLPVSLGWFAIANYDIYEVQFPVRTTAPLNGISNPSSYLFNTNVWGIGNFDSPTPSRNRYDNEPIYVPAVAVNTSITAAPPSSTTSTSASFSFSSNKSGATYQCRLDSGSWAGCSSPKGYSGLTPGSHTFWVAAVDSLGHVDPTPASSSWTITTPTTTTPTTTTPTTTTPTTTTPTTTTPTTTTTHTTTTTTTTTTGTTTTRTSTSPTSTPATSTPATSTSSGGSGKISVHLTKTSFKSSQAAKVKLIYSFSPKSKLFAYALSIKKGLKWKIVRSVRKMGSFNGKYTMTVKKLFGVKPVKRGQYRLKLSADKNSRLLSFKVT